VTDEQGLTIDLVVTSTHSMLRLSGVLDSTSYGAIRDAVVKAAIDQPPAVVVEVTDLRVPQASAWAVFTSARWLTSRWPDVPMALVCTHPSGRSAMRRIGIHRYVPVYGSVASAVATVSEVESRRRRRVRQGWRHDPSTLPAAQQFVAHWLTTWGVTTMIPTASVVATVLVDNALTHTDGDLDLRLEHDGRNVTVAVTDTSPMPAAIAEDAEARGEMTELMIVDALSVAWGNTPSADGKVVWAVLGPQNLI
jgi:hypothetical protein